MAAPFDFSNTPITEQTTLVARYRSTTGGGAYGGKWFRLTTNDGKQYVPQDYTTAYKWMTTSSASHKPQLLNQTTGELETAQTDNIIMVEFGGGWETLTGSDVIEFFSLLVGTVTPVYPKLARLTGYPQGLRFETTGTGSRASIFGRIDTGEYFDYAIPSLDCTGFTIDEDLWTVTKNEPEDSLFLRYSGPSGGPFGEIKVIGDLAKLPGVKTPFSAYVTKSTISSVKTYTKGFGFVGPYSEAMVARYPSITASAGTLRKTYLG